MPLVTTTDLDALMLKYSRAVNGEDKTSSIELTTQKVDENLEKYGMMLDFFMQYPDVFLDVITPKDSALELYPFQRVSLRAKMRKRQTFETATRGASKSWIAFASRYLTCMFVPKHTSFVCTDVKEQAVAIAREKIQDDLWVKYPLLANEMKKYIPIKGARPETPFKSGKGYASYRFTSGSMFDVVGVDSARGKRRHSGIIEEVIEQNQTKVNEKIIPLMNIDRSSARGFRNPHEPFNQQKIFVTSAGYMGTFAYDKMIETLLMMLIYPDDYFCISLDYRVPMRYGLLNEKTIRETRTSPAFDPGSFEREYNSRWSGEIKGAAISISAIQRTRTVKRADYKARVAEDFGNGDSFYVVGADMAKDGSANTAISVIRVVPAASSFRYIVVNGYTASSSDYEVVSAELKKTVIKYNARLLVIDANGIGAAIRDWLNKPGTDPKTGEALPGFGIINPPKSSSKDVIKYRQNNLVYEIKANGSSASDINSFFFSRIKSGAFKMLVSNRQALDTFSQSPNWMAMDLRKQQTSLRPYQFCDKLEQELGNLDLRDTGDSMMKVIRRNDSIEKDLFSSVSYAMYGTHNHIELRHYKNKHNNGKSKIGYYLMGVTNER